MGRKKQVPARPAERQADAVRLSALCARAERELRCAARDLRDEDPVLAAGAVFAFAELREALARLREQAIRRSGH